MTIWSNGVVDLLAHLRGFVAVAEELSVSRAAETLGIDQPLLSRRIRALERHLETELLDRSRRQIGLTSGGVSLLPRAQHLLEQADDLVRSARRPASDSFVVSMPGHVTPRALAEVVRKLRDLDVVVTLRDAESTDDLHPAWIVRPCHPADATWTTPLGIASLDPLPRSPARLVELRPLRGCDTPTLVFTDVDDDQPWSRHLQAAIDRAGVSPRHVQRCTLAIAVAHVLDGTSLLVTTAGEASAHDLTWTPLDDPTLARGHQLVESGSPPTPLTTGPTRSQALRLLGRSLGAAP